MPLSVTSVIGNFHFCSPVRGSMREHRAVADRFGPVVDRTAPDARHRRRAGHRHERPVDAAAEVRPFLILDRRAAEDRRVVFPRRRRRRARCAGCTTASTSSCRPDCPATSAARPAAASGSAGRARRSSLHPVHLHERLAEQELAGLAIEHVEEAVAVRPHHRLGGAPLPGDVGEHRHLHRVVVVASCGVNW